MKYYIYFLSLFLLIILTFSCGENEVKLGEDGEGEDICGTAINDCVTYSDSSTAEDVKCENCSPSKRLSSDSSECLDPITDCEEYVDDDSCKVCGNGKVPDTTDGSTCVACEEGEETKDGKTCFTIITDCEEYTAGGTCEVCGNGKIPAASTADSCVACGEGKETQNGKTCYTKITDCSEHTVDGLCSTCSNGKVPAPSTEDSCVACS